MSASGAVSSVVAGHEAFRALLLALSHPGRAFSCGVARSPAAVLSSVFEQDVPLWRGPGCDVPLGRPVALAEAELLLVDGSTSDGALRAARRGSEEHPERAATAVYLSRRGAPRTAVRLSGPGVDGSLDARLPLAPSELEDRAQACAAYPTGVDLLLLDPDGLVVGLPRTTRVEVLG